MSVDSNQNYVADRDSLSWKWLVLCFVMGFIYAAEKILFGISGENLTAYVRLDLMKGIIYKQLSWFDDEKRAPGILSSIMSENVVSLNGMTTETVSVVLEAILAVSLGIMIACLFSWRTAVCTALVSPIMIIGVVATSTL